MTEMSYRKNRPQVVHIWVQNDIATTQCLERPYAVNSLSVMSVIGSSKSRYTFNDNIDIYKILPNVTNMLETRLRPDETFFCLCAAWQWKQLGSGLREFFGRVIQVNRRGRHIYLSRHQRTNKNQPRAFDKIWKYSHFIFIIIRMENHSGNDPLTRQIYFRVVMLSAQQFSLEWFSSQTTTNKRKMLKNFHLFYSIFLLQSCLSLHSTWREDVQLILTSTFLREWPMTNRMITVSTHYPFNSSMLFSENRLCRFLKYGCPRFQNSKRLFPNKWLCA